MMEHCPDCGQIILKDAIACKHCGKYLKDIDNYLKEKGSIYANHDNIEIEQQTPLVNPFNPAENTDKICVFCHSKNTLNENEVIQKKFECTHCGKKNKITSRQIEDILTNVPIGWGWFILIGYFGFSLQKYLSVLDDDMELYVTLISTIVFLLLIYFFVRRFIFKRRFIKKNSFGTIYNVSMASGAISTFAGVLFVVGISFIYPYTGLRSDKIDTDNKINYYISVISNLSEKQKAINQELAKNSKTQKEENIILLNDFIKYNNIEKQYSDSIFNVLNESKFYTGKIDFKMKSKSLQNIIGKIYVNKILSANTLKNYYSKRDEKLLSEIQNINLKISELNRQYVKEYKNLFDD